MVVIRLAKVETYGAVDQAAVSRKNASLSREKHPWSSLPAGSRSGGGGGGGYSRSNNDDEDNQGSRGG